MTKTEIKICGLSTEESVASVIKGGADYMGLIFFDASPRNVSIATARDLSRFAGDMIKKVAVTVNASEGLLDRIIETVEPDVIQLHGAETPKHCAAIKQRYKLPIIKAFAIRDASDLENTNAYHRAADQFLFDAKAPIGSKLPGGNGVTFDWDLLANFVSSQPYMLSGGIDSFNVIQALEMSGAKAIDVSSGVESTPGVKDIAKITNFINTIRNYDKKMAQ